jgi:hypothetical protein
MVVFSGKAADGGVFSSGYAWSGMALRNDGAMIILKAGSTTLHQVEYGKSTLQAGKAKKAFSRQLGSGLLGSAPLSCAATVPTGAWCEGQAKYDANNTGTPGKISDCKGATTDGGVDGPGTCNLAAGDVLVSEVLPNPESSTFQDEWLELYNNTASPVNLGCLEVRINDTYSCKPTGTLAARGYKVLHHGGAGAPSTGFKCSSLSLNNDKATIEVKQGSTVLHKISYGKTPDSGAAPTFPAPKRGVARQLDGKLFTGSRIDPAATRKSANWCDASNKYDSSNLGTPGTKNTGCGGASPDAGPGDAAGSCKLAAGELLITEVQSDPKDDPTYEWLELYNNSGRTLTDLSCVKVEMNANSCTLSGSLANKAFLVLHRGKTGSPSGGLSCTSLSLHNERATLHVKAGGVTVHTVRYADTVDSGPKPTFGAPKKGVATQLTSKVFSNAGVSPPATQQESNWCGATAAWGSGGNKGTPGKANGACP